MQLGEQKGARHPVLSWPDQAPLASGLAGISGPEREQVEMPSRSPLILCFLHCLAGCSQETLCGSNVYTQKLVVPNKALYTEHL